MDDATANDNGGYDDRTIGRRLRHIRQSRKLSLTVVAGLAGTSASTLSRIENGILALDSRKLVVALAKALRSMDLRWQDAVLARQLAEELGDPIMLGIAARGASSVMLGNGRFDLARDELDATTVPTATNEGMQLSGMLALERSIVTAAQSQTAESAAALDYADELAVRTTGDAFALGFSPVNVGMWRMAAALECGEPDEVIRVAQTVNPQEHPYPARRAAYWADYGRALTSVRRRDEAARALLRAEKMHPVKVLRNSFARDSLAELVAHSKDDALGREIRGMAYRAGLPV